MVTGGDFMSHAGKTNTSGQSGHVKRTLQPVCVGIISQVNVHKLQGPVRKSVVGGRFAIPVKAVSEQVTCVLIFEQNWVPG